MTLERKTSVWRWALLGGVLASWPIMVWRMWSAFWTVPSAELLERQRLVELPTMSTFWMEVGVGAVELALVSLLLWPRWRKHYRLRLLAVVAGTAVWFFVTTPLAISSIERVHRQWLALVHVATLLALVLALLAPLARWALRRLRRP